MLERLRAELGNPSKEVISDDLLDALLVEEQENFFGAASRAAEIISRVYAQKADESLGDYSVNYSRMAKRWGELADELQEKSSALSAKPFIGGISRMDKQRRKDAADRPTEYFSRDMRGMKE